MDDLMFISTGKWQATQEQLAFMKAEYEKAIARERKLREAGRRGILTSIFEFFTPDELTEQAMRHDEKAKRGKK
jgi:hypothetical protein